MTAPRPRPLRGFTLVELVVTVAILGVLVLGAAPVAQLVAQRAKEQELRAALRQIRGALDDYTHAFDEGRMGWDEVSTGKHYSLRNLSSLAFGGADLRTVYLGSLFNDAASVWQAPVAGAQPDHWRVGPTVID